MQLLDMTVGEGPQERPQRRGRPDPREQLRHRAVAQHVEVIDAVRADQHPRDHTAGLGHRVRRVHGGMLGDQVVQTGFLGQPQHRDQSRATNQVRVIENRGEGVRGFHLRGGLPAWSDVGVVINIFPVQGNSLSGPRLQHRYPSVDQG